MDGAGRVMGLRRRGGEPMTALNRLACVVALLLAAGQIARFWGKPRFVPMAVDELLVAAALLFAAWRARRDGANGNSSTLRRLRGKRKGS